MLLLLLSCCCCPLVLPIGSLCQHALGTLLLEAGACGACVCAARGWVLFQSAACAILCQLCASLSEQPCSSNVCVP